MKLIINNPKFEHNAREMITAYFPKLKIETASRIPENDDYVDVCISKCETGYLYTSTARICADIATDSLISAHENKLYVSKIISRVLNKIYPVDLPWGILTGIRPAKMVRELADSGVEYSNIYNLFVNEYEVDPDKARLAIDVAKKEAYLINGIDENAVSLYIGIPFCPTRCLYCSFTSQSIDFSNKLVKPYMESMFKEIDFVRDYINHKSIPIETIYIGGGTPTALDEYNLAMLCDKIADSFDLSAIKEYTVEAGRPDTITREKLKILKNANVSRISINPQTMNDKTLKLIGRRHSSTDIIKCYEIARELNFGHINADIIAGLPEENIHDFNYTLEQIKLLNPESVTVHTMSIKHGSYLDMNYSMYTPTATQTVNNMLSDADRIMRTMNKQPYYLYRQKNMLGNLENVGYSNPGYECLYNIYIMEEVQSIISIGAGGSTKKVDGSCIERVFNVKEVSEYIKRTDEMIERKSNLLYNT